MSSKILEPKSKNLDYLKIGTDDKQQITYDIGSKKFGQIYSDYPVVAYVYSSNEIVIVNLLDPAQKQMIFNIHPYYFVSFVKTEVECNKTLFFRKYEKESHILLLAQIEEDSKAKKDLHLLVIRVDAMEHQKPSPRIVKTLDCRALTCFNGHKMISNDEDSDEEELRQCDLCGEENKVAEMLRCESRCNARICKNCI